MESKQPDSAQPELLNGWKDIAHYLGRGVRTAQRYERELGLPIRRPSGRPGGAVVAIKSELDSWVKSAPTAGSPFETTTRPTQIYLSSELAKRLQERAHLHAQMMALRTEMKVNIRTVRESIVKIRQQLKETQKRQDSISSVIRQYSKALHMLPVDGKHRKPN